MKKPLHITLYYLAGYLSVILSHFISPTNMAGPGFDDIVYLLVLFTGLFIFGRSCYIATKNKFPVWIPVLINIAGIAGLITLLFIPNW